MLFFILNNILFIAFFCGIINFVNVSLNSTSKAKSKKKAIGLWQFIPATARHFGLKIDNYVATYWLVATSEVD